MGDLILWKQRGKREAAFVCGAVALLFFVVWPFFDATWAEPFSILERELLAKAAPDECYNGIGEPYACGPDSRFKVNQAYVWGLAKAGDKIFFGTMANTHCLVLGAYLGMTTPHENDSWVCEFGESQLVPLGLPDYAGDWRPPHIYLYDLASRTLLDITPELPDGQLLTSTTIGIRSAGALGDVVILGGPALSEDGGINLFAYHAGTGAFLGMVNLSDYTNIRKWLVVNGVLYTAVGRAEGGGAVLRWRGNLLNPFQFEVVGLLDGQGAELAYHEGRIFVSTWPDWRGGAGGGMAGLWMSPVVPPGGLTEEHADAWRKVWQADDYEPDPLTAMTYGGGALASFGGWLYWGTMHVPLMATMLHFRTFGYPETEEELLETFRMTWRAVSIFRGRNFASKPQIHLLYGEQYLPRYTPDPGGEGGEWDVVFNNMGPVVGLPLYGSSGFDNPFNNYTWTMGVYKGQLYVGTMDWSYLLEKLLPTLGVDPEEVSLPARTWGADLYRFISTDLPAIPESFSGVGNHTNYGIRTMLPDEEALYLGMANPMNLMTDPEDDEPEGGWELLSMTPKEGAFPAQGTWGSEFTISGDGFGTRKGTVKIGGKKVKVLAWTDTAIYCRIKRPPVPSGSYDITIRPRNASAMVWADAFDIKAPELIVPSEPLRGVSKAQFTLSGLYFGTKKGKIFLQYLSNGKLKRRRCKVLSWSMDPLSGQGSVEFSLPRRIGPGTYDLVLVNRVGSDTWVGGVQVLDN